MLAFRHPLRFVLHLVRHRSVSSALWVLDYEQSERLNGPNPHHQA